MKVLRWSLMLLALVHPTPLQASEAAVTSSFSLLVGTGRPAGAQAAARLVDSGIVIPLADSETGAGVSLRLPLDVPSKLERTLLLEEARIETAHLAELTVNRPFKLSAGPRLDGIGASVRLLEVASDAAIFQVQFRNDDKVLADSNVAVGFGSRAVVGARSDSTGQYFFLVLNPLQVGPIPPLNPGGRPLLVEFLMPRYPEVSGSGPREGLVRLRGIVGVEGKPVELEVIETPSDGLAASAMAAIRSWRYLPGRDSDGKHVRVQQTWTFRFRLE